METQSIQAIINAAVEGYGNSLSEDSPRRNRFEYPIEAAKVAELLFSNYERIVLSRRAAFLDEDTNKTRAKIIAAWLTNRNCKPSILLQSHGPQMGKTTMARAIIETAKGLWRSLDWQEIQRERSRQAGHYCPLSDEERDFLEYSQKKVIIPTFYTPDDIAGFIYRKELYQLDRIAAARFIIIDDLAKQPGPPETIYYDGAHHPFEKIIYYRAEKDLPTIITTNETFEGMERYGLGSRVIERLRGMCEIVNFSLQSSYSRR